jgi:hypothetical protein
MDEKERFRLLVEEDLRPMFPGSSLEETASKNSELKAAYDREFGQSALRLQLMRRSNHALLLRRSQYFTREEKLLAGAFVAEAGETIRLMETELEGPVREAQQNFVVAKAITASIGRPNCEVTLQSVLSLFQKWAQETYEGKRIATALGLDDVDDTDGIPLLSLKDYSGLKLAQVVGDGCTTLIRLSREGRLVDHIHLASVDEMNPCRAPFPFIPMATWAAGSRIAVALNRNGEILVFSNGALSFARRRGQWLHFSHQATINQMAVGGPTGFYGDLREAAYLSALDISFSRLGGVIGIIRRGEVVVGTDLPVREQDILQTATDGKCLALRHLVHGRRYQDLGRPLRQEVGGVDGAVVVKYNGELLAAGAVLAVKVTGDEGARTTAAKTIGRYGIGIKISSDGRIDAFSGNGSSLFSIG